MATVDTIITKFVQQGVSGLKQDFRDLGGAAASFESRLDRTSDRLLGFGAAGAGAMALIGGASLRAYGQIQMAEIGFSKSLGSMDAAKAKIEELRQFDRQSPFNFQESVKGAMRLRAVGFEADKLKSVLTDIGDAAAGTGGGTEEFMGITRAMGQMRAKGRISMEEINQLGDRGVNALQILQQQLKLTDEQVSEFMKGTFEIKSDVGVEALLKGFRELYGGAMLEASKTFPGQVSNLQSAVEQLGAAIGEVLVKAEGIGPTIETFTRWTDATTEFVKNNPELVKTGLTIAGITTAVGLGAGVVGKGIGLYKNFSDTLKSVTGAKKGLELATLADNAAESKKTLTALAESKAIGGVGKASNLSATAAMRLAGANADAAMAAEDAAKAAGNQAKNLSLLQRAKSLAATPMGGGLQRISAFGKGGGPVTAGYGALGAAAGLTAGISAKNNMQSAGYSDGESYMYGAATGIGAAGAAMFLPGGAVAVAMGEAAAFGINKLFNEPLERRAEKGSGLDDEAMEKFKTATPQERADLYLDQAEEKRTEARRLRENPTFWNMNRASELDLESTQAMMAARQVTSKQRRQGRAGTDEWREAQFAGLSEWSAEQSGLNSVDQQRVEREKMSKRRESYTPIRLSDLAPKSQPEIQRRRESDEPTVRRVQRPEMSEYSDRQLPRLSEASREIRSMTADTQPQIKERRESYSPVKLAAWNPDTPPDLSQFTGRAIRGSKKPYGAVEEPDSFDSASASASMPSRPLKVGNPSVRRTRNGAVEVQFPKIVIPEGPGDRQARILDYNTETAGPFY